MTRDSRDAVAIILAGTIALFIIASLVVVFILARDGHALDDVWAALFALTTAVMGALGGWIAGSTRKQPPE